MLSRQICRLIYVGLLLLFKEKEIKKLKRFSVYVKTNIKLINKYSKRGILQGKRSNNLNNSDII